MSSGVDTFEAGAEGPSMIRARDERAKHGQVDVCRDEGQTGNGGLAVQQEGLERQNDERLVQTRTLAKCVLVCS